MYPYANPNPVNDFYFRSSGQYMQFPNRQQPQVITRFVSSVEEAKVVTVDPLTIAVFLDSGSGKIYLKKLGNSGLSEFYVYSAETQGQTAPKDPIEEINTRLSNIEKFLGGLKNDKSVPDDERNEKPYWLDPAADAPKNAVAKPADVPESNGNDKWKKR